MVLLRGRPNNSPEFDTVKATLWHVLYLFCFEIMSIIHLVYASDKNATKGRKNVSSLVTIIMISLYIV